jgi:hypothetical protein
MYQLLSQHNEEGKFLISVEKLKYGLAFTDFKTGKGKYPGWRMFAEHILERLHDQVEVSCLSCLNLLLTKFHPLCLTPIAYINNRMQLTFNTYYTCSGYAYQHLIPINANHSYRKYTVKGYVRGNILP